MRVTLLEVVRMSSVAERKATKGNSSVKSVELHECGTGRNQVAQWAGLGLAEAGDERKVTVRSRSVELHECGGVEIRLLEIKLLKGPGWAWRSRETKLSASGCLPRHAEPVANGQDIRTQPVW